VVSFGKQRSFVRDFFPGQNSLILSRAGRKSRCDSSCGNRIGGGQNGLNLRPFVLDLCVFFVLGNRSKIGVRHGANPNENIPDFTPSHNWLNEPREEEAAPVRGGLRLQFGSVRGGDRRAADNERIDVDLARSYGNSHQ
jgi:hypothetical protein